MVEYTTHASQPKVLTNCMVRFYKVRPVKTATQRVKQVRFQFSSCGPRRAALLRSRCRQRRRRQLLYGT